MRNNRVLNRVDFPMKEKISRRLSVVIREAFTFWWHHEVKTFEYKYSDVLSFI